MKLLVKIFGVSVLSVLVACGSRFQQLELPPQRSYHSGFSLLPPNEEGWNVISFEETSLNLARDGSNANESYAIQVEVWGLPSLASRSEFINFVKKKETEGSDYSRFKFLKHDVAPYSNKGEYCVLSHSICEDRAAKVKHSGGLHLLILEIVSLTCRHPSNANVAISVSYSHRHYPYQGDPSLSEKAEKLFESVEFTELR